MVMTFPVSATMKPAPMRGRSCRTWRTWPSAAPGTPRASASSSGAGAGGAGGPGAGGSAGFEDLLGDLFGGGARRSRGGFGGAGGPRMQYTSTGGGDPFADLFGGAGGASPFGQPRQPAPADVETSVTIDFAEALEGLKTVLQHRWDEAKVLFGR